MSDKPVTTQSARTGMTLLALLGETSHHLPCAQHRRRRVEMQNFGVSHARRG
jgi:hypothetical protein